MLGWQQSYSFYINPLASDRSICIECHVRWQWLREKQMEYAQTMLHSCMLPNEIVDITSWLMISRCFFCRYRHVAYRLCRDMTWWQNRDMTSRTKTSCSRLYRNRMASMLSTSSQMMPKWAAAILWQKFYVRLNMWFLFEEGRRIRKDLRLMPILAQFTQVGLSHLGSKNKISAAFHTHSVCLI
jgi:hypothetical protein